jgi:hypothetical protein
MSLFVGSCQSKSLRQESIIFNECVLRLLKGSVARVVGLVVLIADKTPYSMAFNEISYYF